MLCVVLNYDPTLKIGEAIEASLFNEKTGRYPRNHTMVFKSNYGLNQYQTFSFYNRHDFVGGIATQLELDYRDRHS